MNDQSEERWTKELERLLDGKNGWLTSKVILSWLQAHDRNSKARHARFEDVATTLETMAEALEEQDARITKLVLQVAALRAEVGK